MVRGYCMKTGDAIVRTCLWWLTLNGKAHNFVFCIWLVMSSKKNMIRKIFFFVAGLSNVQKIRGKILKNIWNIFIWNSWRICDVYTIYFNRSQHAIAFQRTFERGGFQSMLQYELILKDAFYMLSYDLKQNDTIVSNREFNEWNVSVLCILQRRFYERRKLLHKTCKPSTKRSFNY